MTLFSSEVTPALPALSLSAEDQGLIARMNRIRLLGKFDMELAQAYYDGEQVISNLRIAVPAELEFLRTIVGWAAKAVDPYVARVSADCFRIPTATDGDDHLSEVMEANGFRFEQGLAVQDALTLGRGLWVVGSPKEEGDAPVITVESPLATTVLWDSQGKDARALMSHYYEDGEHRATFMAPGRTIHLAADDGGQWRIADRDDHGFDFVPVVRMPHAASTVGRNGRSAITPALRSAVDSACRTLLGLEVARELYSAPQKVILGAVEAAFKKADGTDASSWETYIHKTLGLERDEEGNLPEIHQFQAYDPSVFTKVLDWYASAASSIVGATPQDMGLYTQGNPPTAESIDAMNNERNLRATQLQRQFESPLIKVAQMALRFENDGELPAEYRRLAVDWNPVNIPNPVLVSDGITKQIAVEALPPRSDVTLKALGHNEVDRKRLEQDWKREDGRQAARAIAEGLATPPAPTQQGTTGGGAAGQ